MKNFNYHRSDAAAGARPWGVPESACSRTRGTVGYSKEAAGSMGYTFDAEYVRRLAEGDALVEEHFLGYFGRLLQIKLRRKLRNRDEIEDARQETFTRVLATLRGGEGVRDPRRLGAFVNSVCENVVRELARKVKRMPLATRPASDRADPCEGVDETLVRSEVVEHVRAVLDELPPDDRVLLRDVFLEERDRDEVCRKHQVSREYLRVLLHRAKDRFRRRYHNSIARQARAHRGRLASGDPRPRVAD